MVAFRARATTSDLVADGVEVTDARWFTRADLHRAVRDGEVLLPMRTSVALALIEQWYGGPLDDPPADEAPAALRPSRARTSASDGFVVADPSGKTTVGTVRFPALTRSTYSAASSWCSTSTSVNGMPAWSS